MGSLRVGHNGATSLSLFTFMHWRRKWQPTPVFLLENSRDGGAWWAAVYGVSQSWTRLKRPSSSSSSSSSRKYKCELDANLSPRPSILLSPQFIKLPLHYTYYPPHLCSGQSLCWSLLLPHHSCLNSACPLTYVSNATPSKHFLLLTTRNHVFNTLVALASGICPPWGPYDLEVCIPLTHMSICPSPLMVAGF